MSMLNLSWGEDISFANIYKNLLPVMFSELYHYLTWTGNILKWQFGNDEKESLGFYS